jgi:hypothetical protein
MSGSKLSDEVRAYLEIWSPNGIETGGSCLASPAVD